MQAYLIYHDLTAIFTKMIKEILKKQFVVIDVVL